LRPCFFAFTRPLEMLTLSPAFSSLSLPASGGRYEPQAGATSAFLLRRNDITRRS